MISNVTRAIAELPTSTAPPSFANQDWLVALNLWIFTAGFAVMLYYVLELIHDQKTFRPLEPNPIVGVHPGRTFRQIMMSVCAGVGLSCLLEALVLWAWDPLAPSASGQYLFTKRLLDPVALALIAYGLGTAFLARPGMGVQLRKDPFPVRFWVTRRLLIRPAVIVIAIGIGSTGVVIAR